MSCAIARRGKKKVSETTRCSFLCALPHVDVLYFGLGYLYLQMELCVGGTLKSFLTAREIERRSSIPEAYIWSILSDVVKGLDVLHSHGIVHLDLKPDNIFITEQGRLKVGDFGMATEVTDSSSRMADLEGDGVYMAKELLSSRERLPSADIFCLGITLLEIASGITLPASGEQWHELRNGRLPPLASEHSSDLAALIAQMMHPDPARRPTAASILEHPRVRSAEAPSGMLLKVTSRNASRLYTSGRASKLTALSVPMRHVDPLCTNQHIENQKRDKSRDLAKMNRSASFVKTPRKKRLSLS